jgi:lysophospholipase L1-like esterase
MKTELPTEPPTVIQEPPTTIESAVKHLPWWASLSIALNGLLLLSLALAYWKPALFGLTPSAAPVAAEAVTETPEAQASPQLDTNRKSMPYEEWLPILAQEAKVVAKSKPDRLTVLLGDSLSLWFPTELLPPNRSWLNQGISGESAAGLLKRLNLLDEVQPQTILIMVGVNDLIKGAADEQVLENHRNIIQNLKQKHPNSEIVMQSLLPHGGDRLTVENRDQVLQVSNERIYQLNQKLKALASQSEVQFLNLHSLFVDEDGLLPEMLSTDGLHLNAEGYRIWRSALQVFDQTTLKQPEAKQPEAQAVDAKEAVEKGAVIEPEPQAEATPVQAEPEAKAKPVAKPKQ